MPAAYINDAKAMSRWLLMREYRGLGDTVEAAAGRIERKFGAPAAVILRLRHRAIGDMKISTWARVLSAFQRAGGRIDALYDEERARHAEPSALVRLADFVAGAKDAVTVAEAPAGSLRKGGR